MLRCKKVSEIFEVKRVISWDFLLGSHFLPCFSNIICNQWIFFTFCALAVIYWIRNVGESDPGSKCMPLQIQNYVREYSIINTNNRKFCGRTHKHVLYLNRFKFFIKNIIIQSSSISSSYESEYFCCITMSKYSSTHLRLLALKFYCCCWLSFVGS